MTKSVVSWLKIILLDLIFLVQSNFHLGYGR